MDMLARQQFLQRKLAVPDGINQLLYVSGMQNTSAKNDRILDF